MQADEEYCNQRLDHLGIVAGVCKEIGLVEWLDQQAGQRRNLVSIGTATMAMVLNGLGFSNRQLYLVPQYFANKPVEHLLGEGITADLLHDDCLGRTLDWIAEHDPTTLFAGIVHRAREHFALAISRLHVDTTSFSVSGAYESTEEQERANESTPQEQEVTDPVCIAITYGYSRDHRADLKQWMLALVTTHDGDVPLFMRPLDGNSSDKVSIGSAVKEVLKQLQAPEPDGQEEPLVVFDSGGYSQENIKAYNQEKIGWCSRVPQTSKEAKAAIEEEPEQWQDLPDGSGHYVSLRLSLPQGEERWMMIRTKENLEAAAKTLQKKAAKDHAVWEKRLWHLGAQSFGCQADAEVAWKKAIAKLPVYLQASMTVISQDHYDKPGRPGAQEKPVRLSWKVVPTVQIDQDALAREADRRSRFLIATNVLETDKLSDEALLATYKGQGSPERGFRFLKDPLFLASSVFVKKPSRLIALSFIMVLCLLVYRLAEHLLRQRLQQNEETIPNQINKPTARPTMRWVFQCFEGIELLHIRFGSTWQTRILRLQPLHHKILRLLGPPYLQFYFLSP
jgi:transposase